MLDRGQKQDRLRGITEALGFLRGSVDDFRKELCETDKEYEKIGELLEDLCDLEDGLQTWLPVREAGC
jgi:hypothetical protein